MRNPGLKRKSFFFYFKSWCCTRLSVQIFEPFGQFMGNLM